jgi:hypothetical protein
MTPEQFVSMQEPTLCNSHTQFLIGARQALLDGYVDGYGFDSDAFAA